MNNLILAFIGYQEMLIIFLVVLLLFGAKKIPELARGIGKGMGEFKKAKSEFDRELEMGEYEARKSWDKPTTPAARPVTTAVEPAATPATKQDGTED